MMKTFFLVFYAFPDMNTKIAFIQTLNLFCDQQGHVNYNAFENLKHD